MSSKEGWDRLEGLIDKALEDERTIINPIRESLGFKALDLSNAAEQENQSAPQPEDHGAPEVLLPVA